MVFFKDEIITQVVSDTGGTASINADSSQYKGIEFMYDWRPLDGLRLSGAYTHIDAKYVNFTDQFLIGVSRLPLCGTAKSSRTCRPMCCSSRESTTTSRPDGAAGSRASYYNSYFLNNNNTIGIPAYWVINANLHKTFEVQNNKYIRFAKFFVQLDNIADKTVCGVRAMSCPTARPTQTRRSSLPATAGRSMPVSHWDYSRTATGESVAAMSRRQ